MRAPLPTRRRALAIGIGALAAPWVAARAAAPAGDPRGLERAADQAVQEAGVRPDEPGIAVALLEPGRVLLRKGYGLGDLRTRAPVTPLTRFALASVSKIFTSTGVLILQQRGVLSIDDDVRKYLPELPAYPGGPLRLSHLLHQVSGLPRYGDLRNVPMRHRGYWVGEDYVPEFARQRRQVPLRFPIGAKYEYNNTNFMLMAVVIARAARMPFAQFMREAVFVPAGMTNTFVYDDPAAVPRGSPPCDDALGYRFTGGRWIETWGAAPERRERHLEVGDRGVWTNLVDMTGWDAAIRTHKLLTPDTMRLALTPSKTRDGKTNPYGLGWELSLDRDGKVTGFFHAGEGGGFKAVYGNDPTHSMVLLSNRGPRIDVWRVGSKLDGALKRYAKM